MDREEDSSHMLGRYHGEVPWTERRTVVTCWGGTMDREEDSSHMLGRYHGQRGGQ